MLLESGSHNSPHDGKFSRPKLLLVDDTPSNLAVLSATLKQYELFTATDGCQALEIASHHQPDLILLDVKMPIMDGYEVCRRLKHNTQTRDIPIIFVTGMNEQQDVNQGFALGAVDYITKPISPFVVKARVAIHLELKANRDLLLELAFTDNLTGLKNRRHFETLAEKEWNRASRILKPIHFLMIDIDFFELYNEHYGHSAGDDCLKQISTLLKSHFRRATEILAYQGDGIFLGIMTDISYEHAIQRAHQLQQAVLTQAIPHSASPIANHVTVSMGLDSTTIKSHESWQSLIEATDQALYLAKVGGRNRLVAN